MYYSLRVLKQPLRQGPWKMDIASRLCINTYKTKCFSNQSKYRHFNRVTKPECLYTSETLVTMKTSESEKIESNYLRKILEPKKLYGGEFIFQLKWNQELYDIIQWISVSLRKRRLFFYAHIMKVGTERLTNRILNLQEIWETQLSWLQEVHRDLKGAKHSAEVWDRTVLRIKFPGMKDRRRKGPRFSAEQRIERSIK